MDFPAPQPAPSARYKNPRGYYLNHRVINPVSMAERPISGAYAYQMNGERQFFSSNLESCSTKNLQGVSPKSALSYPKGHFINTCRPYIYIFHMSLLALFCHTYTFTGPIFLLKLGTF